MNLSSLLKNQKKIFQKRSRTVPVGNLRQPTRTVLESRFRFRLITWVFIFFAAIAVPTVIKNTFFPAQTKAAWWNDGWIYRQRVDVTNNESSDLTDFQIKITLDTAALITAGKMQNDCDDIRITDYNGAEIPFWIQENDPGCDDASTEVWVKIPTLPADDGVVYLYYGNASSAISPQHKGEQVFDFFDDFNGASLDTNKWTSGSNGATATMEQTSGELHLQHTGGSDSTAYAGVIASNYTGSTSETIEFRYKVTTNDEWAGTGYSQSLDDVLDVLTSIPNTLWQTNNGGQVTRSYGTTGHSDATLTGDTPVSTYKTFKIEWISGASMKWYYEGTIHDTHSVDADIPETSDNIKPYIAVTPSDVTIEMYTDWYFVRQYTANAPTTAQASEETTPGPIAYWKFDEGADNTCSGGSNDVCDSTVHGNDGVNSGATWQTEDMCVSGKCLYFGGDGDKVNVTDGGSNWELDLNEDLTIQAWIKPNTMTGFDEIVYKNYNYEFDFALNDDGGLMFWHGDGAWEGDGAGAGSIVVNKWHHVSVVRTMSDKKVKFYVNGKYVGEWAFLKSPLSKGSDDIMIGTRAGGQNFDGFIDEVKIYPYARTADEVKQDFLARGGASGAGAVLGSQDQIFMSEGLVGYWKMDEASATTTVTDSSGNGNTGSINLWGGGNTSTASARVAGKYGGGIDFDGGDDYISVPDSSPLRLNNGGTIAVWVKPEAYGYIMEKYWDTSGYKLQYSYSSLSNQIIFTAKNEITYSNTAITNNVWNHIVITFDSTGRHIYINGVEETYSGGDNTALPTESGNALNIGSRGTYSQSNFLDGTIDETRIYNRALSSAEVAELYNWAPGPVGYWDFNEGTGTSTTYDRSGNSNNGTLASITESSWVAGKYGAALELDGSADYIYRTDDADFDFNATQNFTLSAWINFTGELPMRTGIMGKNNGYDTTGYELVLYGDEKLGLDLSDGTLITTSVGSALNDGNWHYVSATIDRGSDIVKFFIDGVQTGSDWDISSLTGSLENSDSFYIGSYGTPSRYFPGKIDEVKIYNYARTTTQIQQDMGGVGGSILGSSTLPDPVAHWRFDEGYGQTANDMMDNQNLTVTDATWKTKENCKINSCLDFDNGTSTSRAYYNDITSSIFDLTNNFSFGAWVYRTDTPSSQARIISKGDKYLLYTLAANKPICYMAGLTSPILTATDTLPLNTWTHVFCTYKDNVRKLYINGALDVQDTPTGTITTDDLDLVIGNHNTPSDSYRFRGKIDEVKIYNSALTPEQVKLDMNAGSSLKYSVGNDEADDITDGAGDPPVAEWSFDENTGSSANDLSGSGNTGTITDALWEGGQCKYGSCLYFDGSTSYMSFTLIPAITETGTYTFESWVKISETGTGNSTIFANIHSATDRNGLAIRSDGYIVSTSYNGAYTYVSRPFTLDGLWHHIAVVSNSGTRTIYIDGKTGTQGAVSAYVGSAGAYFGRTNLQEHWFNGLIDHPKIYDYARTPAQIAYDYNGGLPVAHWRFDECQSATANDGSGNGNNGTITEPGSGDNTSIGTCSGSSGEMWADGASGKFSSSLEFDGTDDYVQIADNSQLQITDEISVCAWVKSALTSMSGGVFEKTIGGTINTSYLLFSQGANYQWRIKDSGATQTLSTLTTLTTLQNTWSHLCGTFTKTTGVAAIYVNGNLDNSDTFRTNPITTGAGVSYIGHLGGLIYPFNGQIDDVRIYNYALSANQVKNVMNENASVRFGN